jgi:hypothetical protein
MEIFLSTPAVFSVGNHDERVYFFLQPLVPTSRKPPLVLEFERYLGHDRNG